MNGKHTAAGAGIVELMVGIFIGVIILLSITASTSFYQAAKSTSVSGNNALSNAVYSSYLIGNGIKQSGLGLTINGQLACTSLNAYYDGVTRSNAGLIAPVMLTDGGVGPDQVSVMYGNSIFAGAPTTLLTSQTDSTDPIVVNLAISGQMGSQALLAAPTTNNPCTLVGITNSVASNYGTTIEHSGTQSLFNPPDPATAYSTPVSYPAESYLLNIGNFHWDTWRLNNNVLQVMDNLTGQTEIIADNIVQLQAEYGVTNGLNENIDSWQSATGTWQILNPTLIPRIRSVRLAIVARSPQREKSTDNNGICNTTTQAPISWAGSPQIDLSTDPNWQCYRYRIIRVVFPLKNIVWGITV